MKVKQRALTDDRSACVRAAVAVVVVVLLLLLVSRWYFYLHSRCVQTNFAKVGNRGTLLEAVVAVIGAAAGAAAAAAAGLPIDITVYP